MASTTTLDAIDNETVMEANRERAISLLIILVNLWLWTNRPSLAQTCKLTEANCICDKLNFSSDGLQQLRTVPRTTPPLYQISVKQLIAPYPDAVMLLLLSEFVEEIEYERFYERALRIPPNADLTALKLKNAPTVQVISVAAPNHHLAVLQIGRSGMRSLTAEFRKLHRLQFLHLDDGSLETLSLDPLANSPQITVLACTSNKIRQLIASRNASLYIPLDDLLLGYNQLETIDGDFFLPLRKLKFVTFEGNRIQRIEGRPISLPMVTMISFVQNQLTQLDVSEWQTPLLVELFLETNNLTRIPTGIERLPSLMTLVVQNNLLTAVDLRRFEAWPNLMKIDLAGNRIRNVLVSGTGRVSMPKLQLMSLANNELAQLEFARWDFPALTTLTLVDNQLHQLPDLFQLFPKLQRVFVMQNPLLCKNVRRWQQYILNFKIGIDSVVFGIPCSTNSTFTLPTGRVLCCVG
ncbi:leucine-rich repeat protein SHOC-2-like [Anopheles maculipalpis]|uniref:leucine-rich repeat protein SHOC-2-like n=1 Tax=Anopheles maculipalpis TaxID=1496333 RepID=UPI0021599355|nr:leucine-rich repeat protein SHOC-2-like [Anopheles maculipalpis]